MSCVAHGRNIAPVPIRVTCTQRADNERLIDETLESGDSSVKVFESSASGLNP
jgi:hypothetical protein